MKKLGQRAVGFCMIALLIGCWDSGDHAARAWIEIQRLTPGLAVSIPVLNNVIDTEPVAYNATGAADPFSPKTALQSRNDAVTSNHGAQPVRFPEASIESLRLIVLLRKQGQSVALISDGVRYVDLHMGDFLGSERFEVLSISGEGILLRQDDGREQRMKFNQRSL